MYALRSLLGRFLLPFLPVVTSAPLATVRMGLSDLTPARIAYQKAHIKDNIGPAIIAVTITLSTLSIVSVALRFFARWKKRIPWQWDDWLCVPSLVGPHTTRANTDDADCHYVGSGDMLIGRISAR